MQQMLRNENFSFSSSGGSDVPSGHASGISSEPGETDQRPFSRISRTLILASGSPRRRDLLSRMGIELVVDPSDADETAVPGEDATHLAPRLARAKGQAAARKYLSCPETILLAADTIVTFGGKLLGKPRSKEEAVQMLRMLSGHVHSVFSGVWVCRIGSGSQCRGAGEGENGASAAPPEFRGESGIGNCSEDCVKADAAAGGGTDLLPGGVGNFDNFDAGFEKTISVETKVTFRSLTEEEIRWYVATGEPMDKAGAYAIQGIAGAFVSAIEGSHSNVIGLPLAESLDLLAEAGLEMPWSAANR